MDKIDIALTSFLITKSRTSYSDPAEKLGLSVNAVHKRIQALKESGMIRNFTPRISLWALRIVNIISSVDKRHKL